MANRIRLGLAVCFAAAAVLACEDKTDASAEAASAVASAKPEAPREAPPGKCKASAEPTQLGSVVGDVYGFAHDPTHLVFSSWDVYGSRGDIGVIRKDGEGARNLASLELEPRSLALDGKRILYTAGIRLMHVPKDGSAEPEETAKQFSAQAIALHGSDVYGVPGDYGPYDRVARMPKKGGKTKELARSDRRDVDVGPNGFNDIIVDADGIYVADSGKDRVIKYSLKGGQPKTLASRRERPFDLSLVGDRLIFNLARKGELLSVGKTGGKVEELGSGLAEMAKIAADDEGVYTVLAGENDDAPMKIAKFPIDGGDPKPLATVPGGQAVNAIALDHECVYWVQRESASKTIVNARAR